MKKIEKRWNKRSIVSILLLLSLVMMPVSAVVIHVTHWNLSVSHSWLHIHFLCGLVFIFAASFHVVYNWKVLKRYLLGKN